MKLSLLARSDEDVERLREAIRGHENDFDFDISKVPDALRYSFPFPVLKVDEGELRGRYFGDVALTVLAEVVAKRAA